VLEEIVAGHERCLEGDSDERRETDLSVTPDLDYLEINAPPSPQGKQK
jgi:hypothetical protein